MVFVTLIPLADEHDLELVDAATVEIDRALAARARPAATENATLIVWLIDLRDPLASTFIEPP